MDGATQMPMSEFEASRWHNSRVCVWCFHQTINKQPCASAYATPAPLQFVLTQGICWFPLRNELTQADATKGFAYASRKPLMTQLLQLKRQGGFEDAPLVPLEEHILSFAKAFEQRIRWVLWILWIPVENIQTSWTFQCGLLRLKGPAKCQFVEIWNFENTNFTTMIYKYWKTLKDIKGFHFEFSYN